MTQKLMAPNYNTPQGVNSGSWTAPPIDRVLTVSELYDFHLDHSPDHSIFVYWDPIDEKVKHITWASAARAVHKSAALVGSVVDSNKPTGNVVLIFANHGMSGKTPISIDLLYSPFTRCDDLWDHARGDHTLREYPISNISA